MFEDMNVQRNILNVRYITFHFARPAGIASGLSFNK